MEGALRRLRASMRGHSMAELRPALATGVATILVAGAVAAAGAEAAAVVAARSRASLANETRMTSTAPGSSRRLVHPVVVKFNRARAPGGVLHPSAAVRTTFTRPLGMVSRPWYAVRCVLCSCLRDGRALSGA